MGHDWQQDAEPLSGGDRIALPYLERDMPPAVDTSPLGDEPPLNAEETSSRRSRPVVMAGGVAAAVVAASGLVAWSLVPQVNPHDAIPGDAIGFLAVGVPDVEQSLRWAQLAATTTDTGEFLSPDSGQSPADAVVDAAVTLAGLPALPDSDVPVDAAVLFQQPQQVANGMVVAAHSSNAEELATDWAPDEPRPDAPNTVALGDWVYYGPDGKTLDAAMIAVTSGATMTANEQVVTDLAAVHADGAAAAAWLDTRAVPGSDSSQQVGTLAAALRTDGSRVTVTASSSDVPDLALPDTTGAPLNVAPSDATAAVAVSDTTPLLDAYIATVTDAGLLPVAEEQTSDIVAALSGAAAAWTTADTADGVPSSWGAQVSGTADPQRATESARDVFAPATVTEISDGWRAGDTTASGSGLTSDLNARDVLPGWESAIAAAYLTTPLTPDPVQRAGIVITRNGDTATATVTLAMGDTP